MTRIAFAAAFLLSCTSFAEGVRGSGNAQRETRAVGSFTGLSVSSGIRGEVKIGPQRVEIEADDNVLPLVETVVEDGTLMVRFKRHLFSLNTETPVVVRVSAPSIDELDASGGSSIRADVASSDDLSIQSSGGGEVHVKHVAVKKLDAHVSGGGGLFLDGSADQVKLALSGGARCMGGGFSTHALRVQASGGSVAELAVSDSVQGRASGGSVIHVRGRPELRVDSTGGSVVDSE
ncbi:MAG TPA: head GIN domain-containing protein [Myxococcales bacterium]|jgi:hypothetical protein